MATGLFGSLAVFDHKNSDFSVFNERLKQFFIANEIKEETRKKAIVMNTLNEECYVLLRNLCIPDLPETKTYSEIIDILTVYFSPVKSYFSERLKFYNARKSMSESVSEWEAKLKSLATNCKFSEEQLKIVLRDIFVIGMGNEKIMSRLFEEDASSEAITLASVVKIALAKESAIKEQEDVQVVAVEAARTNIKVEDVHFSRSPESSRVRKGIAAGRTGYTQRNVLYSGSISRDSKLESRIDQLKETQKKYMSILRLTRILTSHFYQVVQTQHALGEAFSDLAQKSPELQEEFLYNSETQRNLTKNGETLLGALNFFISSVSTLCNKTIEDTLQSIRQYEAARIEYDAYRTDLESLSTKPDGTIGLEDAQQGYEVHREQFMKLRAEVTIKMKFLDENRIKVMHKQLLLFHNAVSAYFSGNQQALEATLKQFNIKVKTPSSTFPSWLEQ